MHKRGAPKAYTSYIQSGLKCTVRSALAALSVFTLAAAPHAHAEQLTEYTIQHPTLAEDAAHWHATPHAFWDRVMSRVTLPKLKNINPSHDGDIKWQFIVAGRDQALGLSFGGGEINRALQLTIQGVDLTGDIYAAIAWQGDIATWVIGYRHEELGADRLNLDMQHWVVMLTARF